MNIPEAIDIIGHELQQSEVPLSDALKLALDTIEGAYTEAQKPDAVLSNSTDLLYCHMEKARNELVLAYNTARNHEHQDMFCGVALALAEVSAQLQCYSLLKKAI